MANLLVDETSPYLRQHKDNPVHWRPWSEAALDAARSAEKPLLISVGYSTCHWCHVMERESFEDPEIAAFMNEHFINIKVDREERPDVDALYMEALQGMTGHGGWPMTVFCDPDGVPFHAGTYFPPEQTGGLPSFQMVLEAVAETFRERRGEIRERAPGIAEQLGALGRLEAGDRGFDRESLDEAVSSTMRRADQENGGFGGAPKFPPASALEFLLDRGREPFVELTLDRMMSGAMYDQLGGGFARYSVDAVWMIPHFEKMLYDNALLARLYLHGWQRTGHERYRRVCTETLDWALREMRDETGGFHSALDADSEGVEGRFYVWSAGEFRTQLTERGFSAEEIEEAATYFGVTEAGNFEGTNALHLARGPSDEVPEVIGRARVALFEARSERVWPGLDDKVLASWNGLMISALAEAGAVLEEERFLIAATECADAVLGKMRDPGGGLLRTMSAGKARIPAFLEDYAYLLEALVVLYESSFDRRRYQAAGEVAEAMIDRFHDPERGGFFTTEPGGERDLIARRKDLGDHPIPSGNSSAALGLLRLAALDGDAKKRSVAEGTLKVYAEVAVSNADSFGHMLQAAELSVGGTRELALIAPADGVKAGEAAAAPSRGALGALSGEAWASHRPDLVRAGGFEGASEPPLLDGRPARDGVPTAYLCRDFACREPVTELGALRAQLAAT